MVRGLPNIESFSFYIFSHDKGWSHLGSLKLRVFSVTRNLWAEENIRAEKKYVIIFHTASCKASTTLFSINNVEI